MGTELVKQDEAAILEQVVVGGDLSKLTATQRLRWYTMRCESAGLDPKTQPFMYLMLNGKLVLYASRTATDQLRQNRAINCRIVDTRETNDVYCVTVEVSDATGRTDTELGAVSIKGLAGDAYANALMKAITKAKRRATLSICGLGMLDETEVETIPGAVTVPVEPAAPSLADLETFANEHPEKMTPAKWRKLHEMGSTMKPPTATNGTDSYDHVPDSRAQSAAAMSEVNAAPFEGE